MSRVVGLSLVGLFIVFFSVLLLTPYVKMIYPIVSGFENFSCKEGVKPCSEGYFCEQSTCVPILPRFDINNVKPF
jgi:hypothetical protein